MKIIFILNTISHQRCIKRIEEFVENGFDVEVYGFDRYSTNPYQGNITITTIGNIHNSMNYFRRIFIIWKSLRKIINKKGEYVYYYFNLDIASIAYFIKKNHYMYEESDLMYTYIKNQIIRHLFKKIDKFIIEKSIETVLTSEGFLNYLYGNKLPQNISVISNRLNKKIVNIPSNLQKNHQFPHQLRIGFVGGIRYHSILNFASVFIEKYPLYEFHFWGNPSRNMRDRFYALQKFTNVYFHGTFINPKDLPIIYSTIDLVLSTYDVEHDNVKYAEPNKLYEAIYFETPIIVSKDTFLAQKVEKMGVGYAIDPLKNDEIIHFIGHLTVEDLNNKIASCKRIEKMDMINENPNFFLKIRESFKNLKLK